MDSGHAHVMLLYKLKSWQTIFVILQMKVSVIPDLKRLLQDKGWRWGLTCMLSNEMYNSLNLASRFYSSMPPCLYSRMDSRWDLTSSRFSLVAVVSWVSTRTVTPFTYRVKKKLGFIWSSKTYPNPNSACLHIMLFRTSLSLQLRQAE